MKIKRFILCIIFIIISIQNIFSEKIYLEVSPGISKWVNTISVEEYNKQGKLIYEKTYLAGGSAWYEKKLEYDKKGNRILALETGGKKTSFSFDENGNEIHFITSDKFEVWNEFDKYGNKIRTFDSDGNETLFFYDECNLLISKKELAKKREKDETLYFYDENNNIIREKSKDSEIKYEYDEMGNCIYSELFFQEISVNKTWYNYDEHGNLLYKKTSSGNEFWYKIEFYKNGSKKKITCYSNI